MEVMSLLKTFLLQILLRLEIGFALEVWEVTLLDQRAHLTECKVPLVSSNGILHLAFLLKERLKFQAANHQDNKLKKSLQFGSQEKQ